MLSTIETSTGITLVFPGWKLRVEKKHPEYAEIKNLLNKGLPLEQLKIKCAELVSNPHTGLLNWFASFGLKAKLDNEVLHVNDVAFAFAKVEPFLKSLRQRNSIPSVLLLPGVSSFEFGTATLAWSGKIEEAPLVARVQMLAATKRGAPAFLSAKAGGTPCLVGYPLDSPTKGTVLRVLDSEEQGHLLMQEPLIKGNSLTYRCEEGDSSGWLTHLSSDSLTEVQIILAEIKSRKAEGRIINTYTNQEVHV